MTYSSNRIPASSTADVAKKRVILPMMFLSVGLQVF